MAKDRRLALDVRGQFCGFLPAIVMGLLIQTGVLEFSGNNNSLESIDIVLLDYLQ